MKCFLKKQLIIYGTFMIILSIIAVIYTLLLYYQKIDTSIRSYNIITFIIGVISFFILGIISGIVANKNGLLEGLIAALMIILITLIINLFLKINFHHNNFVKMGSYLLSSCLGGVIGVNIGHKQ